MNDLKHLKTALAEAQKQLQEADGRLIHAEDAQMDLHDKIAALQGALRELYKATEHLYGHHISERDNRCDYCEQDSNNLTEECQQSPYKTALDKAASALLEGKE